MKCPLKSYNYAAYIDCAGLSCAFADEAGNCLVRQALQCYVSAERTRVAEENDRIRRETELAKTYWAMKKDGTRTPIQFLSKDGEEELYIPSSDTVIADDAPQIDRYDTSVEGGITYAHITPTEKYPHGGCFEVPYYNDGRPKTVID